MMSMRKKSLPIRTATAMADRGRDDLPAERRDVADPTPFSIGRPGIESTA